MALKKRVKPSIGENGREEVEKMDNTTMTQENANNLKNNGSFGNVESPTKGNYNDSLNSDDFFKTEELDFANDLDVNFEIDMGDLEIAPEGIYYFIIRELKLENKVGTKYGIKNRISIKYHIIDFASTVKNEFNITQKYNISKNASSNFYKMYKSLIGSQPLGKINLKELIGIKGECKVEHVHMDDGTIFPRIVNLNPEIDKDDSVI